MAKAWSFKAKAWSFKAKRWSFTAIGLQDKAFKHIATTVHLTAFGY